MIDTSVMKELNGYYTGADSDAYLGRCLKSIITLL